MSGTVTVRRATAADLEALNSLTQASRAYDGPYRAMLDGYRISADQVARDTIYLAERDGEILGYYSLITREPELDLMFVSDTAQGLGVGRLLFAHLRETARRLAITRITIVSHPPSEGFYLRMGAERVGTRPPRPRINWEQPILELAV